MNLKANYRYWKSWSLHESEDIVDTIRVIGGMGTIGFDFKQIVGLVIGVENVQVYIGENRKTNYAISSDIFNIPWR